MTEFELINKLNQKYESKKELERLFKQTRNYEMLIDLENYNDFSKKR
jgi:adenine C2-methylase RlmN of 23S rRNA A2503 and tRNA A37